MATRHHLDDQHIDTLTYYLAVLTQAVTLAVANVEALLKTPDTPDRQRQLLAILQALERVNDRAIHQGLGKSPRTISDQKHLVEQRVAAQYDEPPSDPQQHTPTTSLGCVIKICPCKIAGLRLPATRVSGFLSARNSLC